MAANESKDSDLRKIQDLIKIMEHSGLIELEIAKGPDKIYLKRSGPEEPIVSGRMAGGEPGKHAVQGLPVLRLDHGLDIRQAFSRNLVLQPGQLGCDLKGQHVHTDAEKLAQLDEEPAQFDRQRPVTPCDALPTAGERAVYKARTQDAAQHDLPPDELEDRTAEKSHHAPVATAVDGHLWRRRNRHASRLQETCTLPKDQVVLTDQQPIPFYSLSLKKDRNPIFESRLIL